MVSLVQIANGSQRRVSLVEEPHLIRLSGAESVYELASTYVRKNVSFSKRARELAIGESLS